MEVAIMLYEISTGGIVAYCSDLIVDADDREYAYFLSVGGYQTAVKGILASLVENQTLTIRTNEKIHWIKRCPENYHLKIKKMPSGYCHGIAIPKIALPQRNENEHSSEFLLISNDPDQLLQVFYRHLEAKIEVPLHPSWTNWLWQVNESKEWLVKLDTLAGNYSGYLVSTEPNELQELISKAIKLQEPQIVNCMNAKPHKMEDDDELRNKPQDIP
jgi:hypothetical protein